MLQYFLVYVNPYNTKNLFPGFSYGGLWVSGDQETTWQLTGGSVTQYPIDTLQEVNLAKLSNGMYLVSQESGGKNENARIAVMRWRDYEL